MQAVILCGGNGTRLGELTKDKPKSLVEVAGRPFIDWIIGRLRENGFYDIILRCGHLGYMIANHVMFHNFVRCSSEGGYETGTGGGLRNMIDKLDDKFLVTYGDSYLPEPFDYSEPLRQLVYNQDCDAVMSVVSCPKDHAPNVMVFDKFAADYGDGVLGGYIDYGAIAMTRKVVEGIPPGLKCDIGQVLGGYARAGRVRAYHAPTRFYEIGSLEGLKETDEYLRSKK